MFRYTIMSVTVFFSNRQFIHVNIGLNGVERIKIVNDSTYMACKRYIRSFFWLGVRVEGRDRV